MHVNLYLIRAVAAVAQEMVNHALLDLASWLLMIILDEHQLLIEALALVAAAVTTSYCVFGRCVNVSTV